MERPQRPKHAEIERRGAGAVPRKKLDSPQFLENLKEKRKMLVVRAGNRESGQSRSLTRQQLLAAFREAAFRETRG
jgi:hypothetical protein